MLYYQLPRLSVGDDLELDRDQMYLPAPRSRNRVHGHEPELLHSRHLEPRDFAPLIQAIETFV